MANDHNPIVAVLVKYALRQPLTEDEQRLLAEWESRGPEHRELPQLLRDEQWREQHRKELAEAPTQAMWENISQHIRQRRKEEMQAAGDRRPGLRRWLRKPQVVRAAAIFAAAAGITVLFWPGKRHPAPVTVKTDHPAPQPTAAVLIRTNDSSNLLLTNDGRTLDIGRFKPGETVWTGDGATAIRTDSGLRYTRVKKSEIALFPRHLLSIGRLTKRPFRVEYPNGHRVWLDKGSEMAYNIWLKGGEAPVLQGRALFDIRPDDAFGYLRVKTRKGPDIDVLGTCFAISSVTGRKQTEVELFSGKLAVHNSGHTAILRPNSVALVDEGGPPIVQRMADAIPLPAWMRPENKSPYFEFENTPLHDALEEVADFYKTNLADPYNVKGIPLTGRLPHSQALRTTLRAIEQIQAGRAWLRQRADTIVIIPGDPGP